MAKNHENNCALRDWNIEFFELQTWFFVVVLSVKPPHGQTNSNGSYEYVFPAKHCLKQYPECIWHLSQDSMAYFCFFIHSSQHHCDMKKKHIKIKGEKTKESIQKQEIKETWKMSNCLQLYFTVNSTLENLYKKWNDFAIVWRLHAFFYTFTLFN